MIVIFQLSLAIFLILFTIGCKHLLNNRGYLEDLRIPIVKPTLFFLGSGPFWLHKYEMHKLFQDRFVKFKTLTYGRYFGITPCVVTIDPEIVKSVLIKNFDKFTDILQLNLPDRWTTIDFACGEKWKNLRKLLAPVFASGKIKNLVDPLSVVVDRMILRLDAKVGKENGIFQAKEVFQELSLDAISTCAFGISCQIYQNQDNELLEKMKTAFEDIRAKTASESLKFQLLEHFPGLVTHLNIIPPIFKDLYKITGDIIEERRLQKIDQGKTDFIARIMEILDQKRANPNLEIYRNLSDETILAQGIIFFLAGFGTTAHSMATFCYNMALHQEKQEKTYENIMTVLKKNGDILNHECISQMEYLESALNESLRILGPSIMKVRTCVKDCEVIPGMLIKKGMRVEMPTFSLQNHADFFEDPEKFIPERFLPQYKDEIIQNTFQPFSDGPRMCLGQRFATLEIKIAICKLLQKYKIVPTPETRLQFDKGCIFLMTCENFPLKLEKRQQ